VTPENVETSDM